MEGITLRARLLYLLTGALLLLYSGKHFGQDNERYSEFRNEVFALAIDYKLDEALKLCNNSEGVGNEVLAAKSVIYSLMGNRDKDEKLINKGFDLLKPYTSLKDDYDIHAALAISYSIQANQAGLREQAQLSNLLVKHCKAALILDPNLPHLNFILGRYYYELAGMSAAKAKVAGAFIDKAEIERATFKLAVSYLVKASDLAPSRFLYNYYTGAAYKELGNQNKAMVYFRMADNNIRHTEDDRKADKALQKELK